jgi:hypothetical protein
VDHNGRKADRQGAHEDENDPSAEAVALFVGKVLILYLAEGDG